MRHLTLLFSLLLLLAVAAGVGAEEKIEATEIQWLNYEDGLTKAKETNRHIFIDFTAVWCGWCKKMEKDTFSDKEVIKLVNSEFVPVKIDGDSQREMDIDGYKITETALTKKEFGVTGYPTLYFCKPDGTKLGPLPGYQNKENLMKVLAYVKNKEYETDQPQQPKEKPGK
jgi:thioredoxin-related protein